ncbi:MAG: alkane 1-monooxygenase [Methylocystis sp.]|nr:alkane 1-monooxygenase [Methylocystis sp.]MCA3584070.1 alkane 1-monooxygenase [Methylocystis sp.]MCA3587040.1 alkane 1-monooxygenase [Methylocystis sp.]MCA3591190.1 alkane 1-monooxygenase [Methylocystis sp.]
MWTRNAHYALMNALLVLNCCALLAGGNALWAGFGCALMLSTLVDEAAGDDVSGYAKAPVRFLNAMLFLTLPLMVLNIAALSLLFGSGDGLGLAPFLLKAGIDIEAARSASGAWSLLGALMSTGLFVGAAATNVAHELTHRTQDRAAMLVGRWLLAFSFDTSFSIEHVYGHHRNVGTAADPATARRGEYPLAFFLRSTLHGNISAWRIEAARLRRRKLPLLSIHNRFLTGQAMSLAILAAVALIGGTGAALAFAAVAVQGKLYLELVNFIEHYGLVRVPGKLIEPRHAWNTYKAVSSGLLYNLPRHSHHHMNAAKPFWALEPEPEGPTYPFGYMTMILISLVPPLWRKVVDPRLAEWDRVMASDGERAILASDGSRSPPRQFLPAE